MQQREPTPVSRDYRRERSNVKRERDTVVDRRAKEAKVWRGCVGDAR